MSIILPDTPIPPERINPRFLLIYGPRKVGKTTTLAKLESNLIIDLEEGTDYVSALKIKCKTLEEFRLLCTELCKHKPRKYKYVTIDTIDVIQDWALLRACELYKQSPVGKNFNVEANNYTVEGLANGAGYLWIRKAFNEILQLTYNLADTIIYIGHVKDSAVQGLGTTADSKELDLVGKCKALMCQACDTVGHMFRDSSNKLGINFVSTQNVLCSSRVSHVTGKIIYFDKDKGWEQIFLPEGK